MTKVNQQLRDELNLFLDEQTEQIKQTLVRLDTLRAAVIRRDTGALEKLAEQVRLQAEQAKQNEINQRQLQRKLAAFCECPIGAVNISRFCEQLSDDQRRDIQHKQASLQGLIGRLNHECRAAELMLRECARFNRLLLSCLVGKSNQMRTYTAGGREQWNLDCTLVNQKL